MRLVEVFHTAFGEQGICVALVRVMSSNTQGALEEAYEATQNLDAPWIDGTKIHSKDASAAKGCRSTSVGDLMRLEGQLWKVASFGFEKSDLMQRPPKHHVATNDALMACEVIEA